MTLAQRNLYFKLGIVLASLSLVLLFMLTGRLLPLLPEYCRAALHRNDGFIQSLAGRFLSPEPIVLLAAWYISSLYALFASLVVFFYFEKTQAPEILFFGLFGVSFVFETLRMLVPLQGIHEFHYAFSIYGTRMLVFGRLFGVLSLFVSSVYSAGLDIQKQGRVIIVMVISILLVSFRLPVDESSYNTTFTMLYAYSSMFRLTETVLAFLTVTSFLVAAYHKGNAEYRPIALAALLVSLGRTMLIRSDTWLTPLPGLILLAAGTWFFTTRLRRIYLWS